MELGPVTIKVGDDATLTLPNPRTVAVGTVCRVYSAAGNQSPLKPSQWVNRWHQMEADGVVGGAPGWQKIHWYNLKLRWQCRKAKP